MSSFFDKLKQGATDTAKKAQQAVEITKLKSQVAAKEKEIESHYSHIGGAVYQAYIANDLTMAEGSIKSRSQQVTTLKDEIVNIKLKITEVKNEKKCICGVTVMLDAKFCPTCGHSFD